jgi:hypothetical protein
MTIFFLSLFLHQNWNATGEIKNGAAIAAWEKKNTTAMQNIYAAIKKE